MYISVKISFSLLQLKVFRESVIPHILYSVFRRVSRRWEEHEAASHHGEALLRGSQDKRRGSLENSLWIRDKTLLRELLNHVGENS